PEMRAALERSRPDREKGGSCSFRRREGRNALSYPVRKTLISPEGPDPDTGGVACWASALPSHAGLGEGSRGLSIYALGKRSSRRDANRTTGLGTYGIRLRSGT